MPNYCPVTAHPVPVVFQRYTRKWLRQGAGCHSDQETHLQSKCSLCLSSTSASALREGHTCASRLLALSNALPCCVRAHCGGRMEPLAVASHLHSQPAILAE